MNKKLYAILLAIVMFVTMACGQPGDGMGISGALGGETYSREEMRDDYQSGEASVKNWLNGN